MLHILLILLQLIGWILLVILGILILTACMILLAPLRYRGEGSSPGTLADTSAEFRISWMWSLLFGEWVYQKEAVSWRIRIGWKTFSSQKEQIFEEAPHIPQNTGEETGETFRKADPSDRSKNSLNKEGNTGFDDSSQTGKTTRDAAEEQSSGKVTNRIGNFFNKFKYTFRSVCDTIKIFTKKKELLVDFFTDEVHKVALLKLLAELKKTFQRLAPRKGRIQLEYGFEDPASTGYLLAGISFLYPWIGAYSEIRPNFEEKIFRGDFFAEGHIRLIHFLTLLLHLIFSREVRTTFFHGRHILKKLQR